VVLLKSLKEEEMKNRKKYDEVFKAKVALEDVKGEFVTIMYRVFAFTKAGFARHSPSPHALISCPSDSIYSRPGGLKFGVKLVLDKITKSIQNPRGR